MSDSDLNQNTLSRFQRIILFLLSIILFVFLVLFRIGLSNGSDLDRMARNSLSPFEALSNNSPTIIEFYADWCEACKVMAPDMSELTEINNKKINVVLLNVDNPIWEELIDKYKVKGIPQMNFFDDNGKPIGSSVGVRNKSELVEIFNALIKGKELPKLSGVVQKTEFSINSFSEKSTSLRKVSSISARSHG